MDTSKLAGFLQGALYPVLAALISYAVANLGTSGLITNATITVIATGMLSVLENAIQAKTGRALFGAMR